MPWPSSKGPGFCQLLWVVEPDYTVPSRQHVQPAKRPSHGGENAVGEKAGQGSLHPL
jgi:hypothetical protein